MKKIIMVLLVATAIMLTSCTTGTPTATESPTNSESPTSSEASTHPLASDIGKGCTVQLKRNALGSGRDLPISPTTDSINNVAVNVQGILRAVRDNGILIEQNVENKKYWIPMDSILLIEMGK